MSPIPARIHVLLARQAPIGLVIRRGPSKKVATILWDRERDVFELGQWLHARIYERRSDLSPNGKLFLYFAMNGQWKSETAGSWTAISRAPYLKAIALFSKGDCWHGGGLWTGRGQYWLNAGWGHNVLRNTSAVSRDLTYVPPVSAGGECPGVYYPRLVRDGWKLVDQMVTRKHCAKTIFEKPVGNGWTLRKIAHEECGAPVGKGCYWDEHELEHPGNALIKCPNWEWADLDRKRLVWAADGRLHSAALKKSGLMNKRELFDFNPMAFSPIKAPY